MIPCFASINPSVVSRTAKKAVLETRMDTRFQENISANQLRAKCRPGRVAGTPKLFASTGDSRLIAPARSCIESTQRCKVEGPL